jgi:hypothetical protein
MPDLLAQSYVAHRDEAIVAVGRAREIRSPLLLRAIFVASDEVLFTLWHGADENAVGTATRDVGLRPGRIVHIEELTAYPDLPNPAGSGRQGAVIAGPLSEEDGNESPARRHGT